MNCSQAISQAKEAKQTEGQSQDLLIFAYCEETSSQKNAVMPRSSSCLENPAPNILYHSSRVKEPKPGQGLCGRLDLQGLGSEVAASPFIPQSSGCYSLV